MRLMAVLVLGVIACSSAKPAATSPPVAPTPAPTPPAPAKEEEAPASFGPRPGTPCDFDNDGVPLGATRPGEEEPFFRLEDAGREPRTELLRGTAADAKLWLLVTDQTVNMGFAKMGIVHSRESMLFAVELRPEGRLRLSVTSAEAGPMRIEKATLSDDERVKFQHQHVEQNRKQIGDYYEVLLDDGGQPYSVDPSGDRDLMFAGRMMATGLGMPAEPVGIGARWVGGMHRGPVRSRMEYRVVDRRAEVTTVEARITTVMGPMRQETGGKRQEFWSHDQLDETWTVDPATPVTAFRGKRVMRAFIADCEAGRIKVHEMVTETRNTFAPGP